MQGMVNYRVLLLALMLSISHAAISGHEAAHQSPDTGLCELCANQAQSLTGILPADGMPLEALQQAAEISRVLVSPEAILPVHQYQSRAPPYIV